MLISLLTCLIALPFKVRRKTIRTGVVVLSVVTAATLGLNSKNNKNVQISRSAKEQKSLQIILTN